MFDVDANQILYKFTFGGKEYAIDVVDFLVQHEALQNIIPAELAAKLKVLLNLEKDLTGSQAVLLMQDFYAYLESPEIANLRKIFGPMQSFAGTMGSAPENTSNSPVAKD